MKRQQRQVKLAEIWNRQVSKPTGNEVNKEANPRHRETNLLRNLLIRFNGLPNELSIVDVPMDGNCLFYVLSRQLELHENHKSAAVIRQELVAFMHDSDLFKAVSAFMLKLVHNGLVEFL